MSSKMGWIISGALVFTAIVIIVLKLVLPDTSPRSSALTDKMLRKHEVKVSPAGFLGALPGGAGNAGDDYARAVSLLQQRVAEIARALVAVEEGGAPDPGALEAMRQIAGHVAAGAAKAKMEYTFVHTPRTLGISRKYRPAVELQQISGPLRHLAIHLRQTADNAQTEKVLFDEFVLGWHMMNEGKLVDMTVCGLGVQVEALELLKGLYARWDDPAAKAKLAAVTRYDEALAVLRNFVQNKRNSVFWVTKPQPGDMFTVLDEDEDPSWRMEALILLGVVRHTAAKRGDQKHIQKLLDRYAASSDPLESAAAKAALATTERILDTIGTAY